MGHNLYFFAGAQGIGEGRGFFSYGLNGWVCMALPVEFSLL